MPASDCTDDTVECSLSRIADSLTQDLTLIDWVTSVGLPLAGIAASVLIGIASIRLTSAANRVNERTTAAEQERLSREGRDRFVAHLVEWLEIRWAEFSGADPHPADAQTLLQASLRLRAAVLVPGVDPEGATKVVDAADRAWDEVVSMPVIERRVSATSLKNAVYTLAHSYLALPDFLDDTIGEFDRRLIALKNAAADGRARARLRQELLDVPRPDGEPRTTEEVEALLKAFEANLESAR
ncbi:hypothetical protein [Microbacterium maritypicum]